MLEEKSLQAALQPIEPKASHGPYSRCVAFHHLVSVSQRSVRWDEPIGCELIMTLSSAVLFVFRNPGTTWINYRVTSSLAQPATGC
jgi:hypothetical protein